MWPTMVSAVIYAWLWCKGSPWKHGRAFRPHYEDLWNLPWCTGVHSYKAKEVISWKLHVMPEEQCPLKICVYVCVFIYLFIYLFTYLFTYSFIPSFIYLSIYHK